jgi:hypothetical protein
MWYTHNIIGGDCLPPSTTTSISTRVVYRNGTVGPVQTVTAAANASTITITKPGSAPVQIETSIGTTTERITETSYASGSLPSLVTLISDRILSSTVVSTTRITISQPVSIKRIVSTERITGAFAILASLESHL